MSNDAVIAGSVTCVLGALVLLLLLVFFVLKRRNAVKHRANEQETVNDADDQDSNGVYVVSENDPSIPGRADDEPPSYLILENIPDHYHFYVNGDYHRHTNYYNNIHSTDYVNFPIKMVDGSNYIRGTEGVVSHSGGDYINMGGLAHGEDNKGYLEDDYNQFYNPYNNTSEGVQSENYYANIGIKESNDHTNNFEPDDIYVIT